MSRVDFDRLKPSDDALEMLYEGQPFSGVAYEVGPSGVLVSETSFINGQKSGVSREWSPTGVLIREQVFLNDALDGMSHEWYDNGQVKSEGEYKLSVCIKEKAWDEEGSLTREYTIDPNSPQFSTLQRLRAWKAKG